MARARNIKPSFFQNEQLGILEPIDRIAFIGMWTVCDFRGCLEYRPIRLKIQLMPYDDCDFAIITNNLEHSGLVKTYTVSGEKYIKIINFQKHQNPHKNERDAGSNIPDIDKQDVNVIKNSNLDVLPILSETISINPEDSASTRADSLFPLPDSLFPLPDSQEQPFQVEEILINTTNSEKSENYQKFKNGDEGDYSTSGLGLDL